MYSLTPVPPLPSPPSPLGVLLQCPTADTHTITVYASPAQSVNLGPPPNAATAEQAVARGEGKAGAVVGMVAGVGAPWCSGA